MKKIFTLAAFCSIISFAGFAQPGGGPNVTAGLDQNICPGDSVTLMPQVFGGSQPYTYLWSPTGDTTRNIRVSPTVTTTYIITVTDRNGMKDADTVKVNVTGLTVNSVGQVNAGCGQSNGSATVAATGGTVPYTYAWNTTPPQTGSSATGLSAGTYTVTATDNKGCTGSRVMIINNTGAPTVNTATTQVSCPGGSDGTATANATGGTPPYTYSWNTTPAQTTKIATGLTAGGYIVTVTDSNGCIRSATANITERPAATLTFTVTDATCGKSNGSVCVKVTGGTSPYTYYWSAGGDTTSCKTGLSSGTYSVLVTDKAGCTVNGSGTVIDAGGLTLKDSVINVKCNGGSDGGASIIVTGGTTPYTYTWSTGDTTASITKQKAGKYTVTVTDPNGCSGTATVTINQPVALKDSVVTTNTVCNGPPNGSATSNPSGGVPPYTYAWSTVPVSNTKSINNRSAGTYTVTVRDRNGCSMTSTAVISENGAPSIAVNATNISCAGDSNGTATAVATGGTTPYSYSWSSIPVQTTASATGLKAGTYTVTVTGNDGCSGFATVKIIQPAALKYNLTFTNISCKGTNDGTACIKPTGGTVPYTYSWSTGSTTDCISGLPVGTFTVTLTDSAGCTAIDSVTISEPTALLVFTAKTDVSCFGGDDGSASAQTTGGTPAYTYSWSNGSSGGSINKLTAGVYTVTVNDAGGCTATATVTIGQPSAIGINITTVDAASCGGITGSATASVTGGTSPYTYSWSTTPSQIIQTASGLSAGAYTVTVTDNNGCTQTAVATINDAGGPSATVTGTNVTCNSGNDGTATAVATGGTSPYTYSWNTTPPQTTNIATGLSAGTYIITVTGNDGCIGTNQVTITEPDAITITLKATDASCNGVSDGSICATVTGGTVPYTYSWSPSGTGACPTGLSAGTYIVTVSDNSGCTATGSATVAAPAALTVSTTQTNATCNGCCDGSATANPSGGTSPYTYAWSPSAGTGSTAKNLCAICYTVTVTDANGCSATDVICITEPPTGITSSPSLSTALNIYPNPFNGETNITYSLNSLSKVEVHIYNILGEQIAVPVNAQQGSGSYKVAFNAHHFGFGPGIYFVKLSVNGKTISTQRVVQLK